MAIADRKLAPTCKQKGVLVLAAAVWCAFSCQCAIVDNLSAAGLDDFTADARSVVTSVAINNGGSPKIFDGAKLVAGEIIYHQGGAGVSLAVRGELVASARDRSRLLRHSLTSGVPNPGTAAAPDCGASGPGVAVRFDSPIVNREGPDLVFFEMHKGTGAGDPFHIAPIQVNPDWHGITVSDYDINASHVASLELPGMGLYAHTEPLRDTKAFLDGALQTHARSEGGFHVIATGIDLSAMGIKEGETISGVVLRSVSGKPSFDPLAILGLPASSRDNLLAEAPGPPRPRPFEVRDRALAGPMAACEEIIFAQRVSGYDHWYGNFGH